MMKPNLDSWMELFETRGTHPESVEILQEIRLGYNSTVYLIAVNGDKYAVKMYHERYNGTQVCDIERNHIARARTAIPDAVPKVYFCSKHTENRFYREILVMEQAVGVPLSQDVFTEQVFDNLITTLTRLHSIKVHNTPESTELDRLTHCRQVVLQFLSDDAVIAPARVAHHFEALRKYYLENLEFFPRHRTIIHGDLWWDNILVDHQNVAIVDWLDSSAQDYCRELAHFKIGTLDPLFDPVQSNYFFERIVNVYRQAFDDATTVERIRYYLPLLYLEEAFYLPFKYFPWKIKYQENAEHFRARFRDYFERSEWFFTNGHEHLPSPNLTQ